MPPATATARAVRTSAGRVRRPTIFDVARIAGVSYSTVSRVVNGHANVRDATRVRVQAAMAELGYVAHVTARALASGRTQAIGLLAQEIDNPFFSNVIKGVDQEVSAADYDLLLCTTHSRREKEAAYVARLSHGMVDGLLIVLPTGLPEYVATLQRRALSVRAHRPRQRGAWLRRRQRRQPGRDEGGHRLPHRSWAPTDRLHRRAPRRGGCRTSGTRATGTRSPTRASPLDEALVVGGDFMEARGRAAAHELLGRPRPPTAIFASSDAAAFGVLGAAGELGLDVPGELSVLGFDDIAELAYVRRRRCRPSASRCARWGGSPCGGSSIGSADPVQRPGPCGPGHRARHPPDDRAAVSAATAPTSDPMGADR